MLREILEPHERAELEQAAIDEYRAGNIGTAEFSRRLSRLGFNATEISTAINLHRQFGQLS